MKERTCNRCGCTRFLTGAALASHQKNLCLGYKRRRTLVGAEQSSRSDQSAREHYEQVHIDELEQRDEPTEELDEVQVMNYDSEEEELKEEVEGEEDEEEEEEEEEARDVEEGEKVDQAIIGEGSNMFMLNSTDRLIHWIRTCQRTSGLLNSAIDKLFKDVYCIHHSKWKY